VVTKTAIKKFPTLIIIMFLEQQIRMIAEGSGIHSILQFFLFFMCPLM